MVTTSPANHWLFQVANTFLLLSYASTDVLVLRIVLMLAGLFFVVWGTLAFPTVSVDTVSWNTVFCVINAYRGSQIAWQRRPIQFEREEHEQMYAEVFEPVGIGRLQFKMLIEQGLMRSLRMGTTFIEAGNDANNLTLIYSGTMSIISAPKDGRPSEPVGSIHCMQFVESPQWANMQVQRRKKAAKKKEAAERFAASHQQRSSGNLLSTSFRNGDNIVKNHESQKSLSGGALQLIELDSTLDADVRAASTVDVTFRASTDITFFTWPIERLEDFLHKNPTLAAPLNAIIGADVAAKLFSQAKAGEGDISSVQRRIYLPLDEPQLPAILPLEETTEGMEEKKNGDEIGISNDAEQATITIEHGAPATLDSKAIHEDKLTAILKSPLEIEKLWLERRGAHDTSNDQKLAVILRDRTGLNRYELSALISKGRWRNILRAGTVIIREGEPVTALFWVLSGSFSVHKGEGDKARRLHSIFSGQMVGSIEFNEPETEHVAGETVTSLEPCTFICWDMDELRELLAPRPRLRAQLTALVAADLAAKFRQVEEIV